MTTDKAEQNLKSATIPAAFLAKIRTIPFRDLSTELVAKFKKAGSLSSRPELEAVMVYEKVPPAFRTSIESVWEWVQGKEASHIIARVEGGSDNPINLLWETKLRNRIRGGKNMTKSEQLAIVTEGYVAGFGRAARDGLRAAPIGAAIAVATAMPITFLKYSFAVAKGEMTKEEATRRTIRDVAEQGVIGGISSAVVVMLCTLCPPIAATLTFVSPALLTVGIGGMAAEYYIVIDENREICSSWFSKNKDKLEAITESIQQIRSSFSNGQMGVQEDQEAIQQVRALEFKAQFGFGFWLQWMTLTVVVGLLSLLGATSFGETNGLLEILCPGLFVGFSQWLLLRSRIITGAGGLLLNIAAVLVSLVVAAILFSISGWLSLAGFLGCTALFTMLSINRLLPKSALFA